MDTPYPAFVIADSFYTTLASLLAPKTHWQLCGATLLEHTLSWLDRSSVDQVYICCCTQESNSLVPGILEKMNYSFKTEVIGPDMFMDIEDDEDEESDTTPSLRNWASLGDCMRYADASDLLAKYASQAKESKVPASKPSTTPSAKGLPDFLLVSANTFAQQPLSLSVQRHRQWRQKDRSCVMTVACSTNSVHPTESGLCLVTDANGRLLHWRDSYGGSHELTIPPNLVARKSSSGGELHLWPRVYPVAAVCAPEILVQFADNFDYENIQDVIRGLLTNEEILGQKIYIDVIDSGLKRKGTPQNTVFHVTDLSSFAYTTRSVLLSNTLSRTPFSLSHLKSPAFYYRFPASFVSSEASTGLSIIEGVSFVSDNVTITGSKPTLVSSSAIGSDSTIGSNCRLEESYLAENCRIEDDVTILFSLLAHSVTVLQGAMIERGTIIGANVTIGRGAKIPSNSFIFSATREFELITSELVRGTPVKTFKLPVEIIGEDASDCLALDINELPRSAQCHLAWPGLLRHIKRKSGQGKSERSRTISCLEGASLRSGMESESMATSDSMRMLSLESEGAAKRREIELDEAIDRTIRENLSYDNAVLEVNSIKHAYGVSIRDLTTSLFKSILTVPFRGSSPINNANILALVNQVLLNPHILPLIRHYVHSHEARVDCLTAIETVASSSQSVLANMSGLLQLMYSNFDIIDDESVRQWYSEMVAESPVKRTAQPFVSWLESAEEESTDDE